MEFRILYESRNRIRMHVNQCRMALREADTLEDYLNGIPGIRKAVVHERTCNIIITGFFDRDEIIRTMAAYSGKMKDGKDSPSENSSRTMNRSYQNKMANLILLKGMRDLFLPYYVKMVFTMFHSIRYLIRGVKSMKDGKLKVEVLDAVSVAVSLVRRDFSTASMVMFLLGIGDLMEEWTRKKSVNDLARSMTLNVDSVWLQSGDTEILTPISKIQPGDRITVRTGNVIPLDGIIAAGEAVINQSSMTGESVPVRKTPGALVYAGSVLEEGECTVLVGQKSGCGRYDKIISMIESSEKMKSEAENRAVRLADQLVPYTFGGTLIAFLLTRNVQKAVSVLMVDFSCALKLSMPLSVITAMRECGDAGIVVKGGRYLEAVAKADTVVFDKTGTLTHAVPKVAAVIPFGSRKENEVLKIAACLEEHYPHSIANAVVEEAKRRKIRHREMHSEVEYVVAHGIASRINGEKTLIGSAHFVFEDEKCKIPKGEEDKFNTLPVRYSHLYLAIKNELAGVICISDPLRSEAKAVLKELKQYGIRNTVMMTGDSERTAASIAAEVGVDYYESEVLPEDKAAYIRRAKKLGHTVIMIGDGINDSPALSEADAGIAISNGAAVARQIADITIRAESLEELVFLRRISAVLKKRMETNYRFVLGFNTTLILLGLSGILTPAVSAMLHNVSTLGISLKSMTNMVKDR